MRGHLIPLETGMKVVNPTQTATFASTFETYKQIHNNKRKKGLLNFLGGFMARSTTCPRQAYLRILSPSNLQTWNFSYEIPSSIAKQVHVKYQLNIFLFSPWPFPMIFFLMIPTATTTTFLHFHLLLSFQANLSLDWLIVYMLLLFLANFHYYLATMDLCLYSYL